MEMTYPISRPTTAQLWTGRAISFILALLLLADAVMKLVKPEPVVTATVELGFAESTIVPMGITLLVSVLLYLCPKTSVLGAILLTGYLGGAVATHVRAGDGAFPILFPAIIGGLLWLGLVLRDTRLRKLVPWDCGSSPSIETNSGAGGAG